jgi:ferrous iron transport protein B
MSGLVAKEVVVSTMSEIYLGSPLEAQAEKPAPFHIELKQIGTGFVSATTAAGREMLEALTPGISIFPSANDEAPRQTALSSALNRAFTPLAGLAFLVYVLLYVPCIATLGVIRSEFGGRWALFSALYQSGIAWLAAVGVYQIGLLLG